MPGKGASSKSASRNPILKASHVGSTVEDGNQTNKVLNAFEEEEGDVMGEFPAASAASLSLSDETKDWEIRYDNFKEAKAALSKRIAYLEKMKKKKTQTNTNFKLPSVPDQDLKNSINQNVEIVRQNLLNEAEFDQEKKCLIEALKYIGKNKETKPIDLRNFCINQKKKIDKAKIEIAEANALLKDIEANIKVKKCKGIMFDIGQQIKLIIASHKETEILENVLILEDKLKKALQDFDCNKFSFTKKHPICNMVKKLQKNLELTGNRKSDEYPNGRNKDECPFLFFEFTSPFYAVVKDELESSGNPKDVDELLRMVGDELELEKQNKAEEKAEWDEIHERIARLGGGGKKIKTRSRKLSNKKRKNIMKKKSTLKKKMKKRTTMKKKGKMTTKSKKN